MRFEIAQAKIAKYASDTSLLSGPQGMTVLNTIASGRVAPTVVSPNRSITRARSVETAALTRQDGQSALLEQSLRDLMEARDAIQQENEDFRHVVVSSGNALREALAISQGEKVRCHFQHMFSLCPCSSSLSDRIKAAPLTILHPSPNPALITLRHLASPLPLLPRDRRRPTQIPPRLPLFLNISQDHPYRLY